MQKHILPNGSFPAYMRGLIGFRQSVGSGVHDERVRLLWKQSGHTEEITVCARGVSLFETSSFRIKIPNEITASVFYAEQGVPMLKSEDRILKFDHSNEAVLLCGTVYCAVLGGPNF